MVKIPRYIAGSSAKENWEFDAIVVGSGIAGVIATMRLSREMRVALITKERLVDSNSFYAQGGLAASLGEGDSIELWKSDTIKAGDGLCRESAVKMIEEQTPLIIEELNQMGVPFDLDNEGHFILGREAFHSVRRIIHAGGDQTGKMISQTMVDQLKTGSQATIFEEAFVVDILQDDNGEVAGVSAIIEDNDVMFSAPNVIIATGGSGQLYFYTSNPRVATGDGMAMALRAGATLVDMEFVQFHPTVCFAIQGQPFLVTEAIRGEGAFLLNDKQERFMPRYHEKAELAPRDIVSRACFNEMKLSGSPWVYLDTTKFERGFFQKRFPTVYSQCLKAGFDPTQQPIPVSPGAHYMMGGIETDLSCRTSIKGLYACGEAGSNGMHGANRLASNSIPEALVTGSLGAKSVLEDSRKAGPPERPFKPQYDREPYTRSELRLENWENIGLVREERKMERHLSKLRQGTLIVPESASLGSLELANMYTVTSIITMSSLERKESRGSHMRTDYQAKDAIWGNLRVHTKAKLDGKHLEIEVGTSKKDGYSWNS
ncbi:MAG TPA: L-aspartate oxidase [Caldisericia bacterium]|nr:L-aspartate oxidase [Caldisericia bacterium]HOU08763.1 L-aspartate oxidase [Caldisericia bacterium]HPL89933.1 L-aspartate oxidase [Caldisericia bacterium]HQG59731.1 L-aspartate oxidase [Caldisericia bacterium]HQH49552.1 L-aspartate oxidase [Caldisericia bacterium]